MNEFICYMFNFSVVVLIDYVMYKIHNNYINGRKLPENIL